MRRVLRIQNILTFLNSVPFFQVFTEKEKESLAAINNVFIQYNPGDYIIREKEYEEAVYIILKGKVNITKNALPDLVLSQLSAGSVFGEITLIEKRPRSSNAKPIDQVVVMKLDKMTIEKLPLAMQNKLHESFVHILIQRLEDMNEKFIQASTRGLK